LDEKRTQFPTYQLNQAQVGSLRSIRPRSRSWQTIGLMPALTRAGPDLIQATNHIHRDLGLGVEGRQAQERSRAEGWHLLRRWQYWGGVMLGAYLQESIKIVS
jgi:hypothetical protein